jgi:hypothetical protein
MKLFEKLMIEKKSEIDVLFYGWYQEEFDLDVGEFLSLIKSNKIKITISF